ncbi:hypothetical protein BDZ89DRAFT_1056131 [Hymenopellis radicata]|nr:hypothetical protein BDZ89DRAFT_1056131 [Hymenopellis radicata]
MAPRALVRHYARCMAECLEGHPLYDPEPHDPYDAFLVEGTQLFDVAWIDSSGKLKYAFSTGLGPHDARNQDNNHGSLLPPGHEKYTGCRPNLDFFNADRHGQCYKSETIDTAQVSANISVPIAPGVAPVSVSTALSYSISDKAGALLFVPDDHTFWYDNRVNLSSNYARKHTAAWYRFLNGDNGNLGVRNGELYFVTSCGKTKEWHNLCAYSSSSARSVSVQFHPIPEADVGFAGSFVCESSGLQPQKGPVVGPPQKETQCVSVVGWKLALCARFIRFVKVPVQVDKAAESTFWSKFLGKSQWAPYNSNQTSISNAEPPASGGNNNSSATGSQATDIKETPSTSTDSKHTLRDDSQVNFEHDKNSEPPISSNNNSSATGSQATDTKETPSTSTDSKHTVRDDPQVKFEHDKIVTLAGDTCWIDTGKQLGIDGQPPSTHALTEVFPYIEESAPWMEVVIAHDSHYLSVLGKGEYVPDAKELAARLMQHFVIDVDEDMNGMLVSREEEHLTKDDLAFVVHDARRYTDNNLGFDVIRKHIPSGWTLAPPRFGLGVPSPVPSTPITFAAVSSGPGAVCESSKPDKSFSISMIDEQDDDDDDDFPLPPPPYTLFNGDSPYAELEAGLASLECLNDFKGAKTIHSDPRWDQYDDALAVWEADEMARNKHPARKFLTRLAVARRRFIQGEPFPEEIEAMALSAVKKLFAALENSGRRRCVRFVKHGKRALEEIGYSV